MSELIADTTFAAAAGLVRAQGVSWLPVLAEGRPVGVVGVRPDTMPVPSLLF